jgi:hypothetical protein
MDENAKASIRKIETIGKTIWTLHIKLLVHSYKKDMEACLMTKSSKGNSFERQLCKDLSLWWTNGENDSVFWRTSGSGGRATSRHSRSKRTKNQYGDVCVVDAIGQPFIDLFVVEAKRGYSSSSLANLLDRPRDACQQIWEEWIQQAQEAHERAGSFSWMIIAQRDRRERIVVLPESTWEEYRQHESSTDDVIPFVHLHSRIRFKYKDRKGNVTYKSRKLTVVGLSWETWIKVVSPRLIPIIVDNLFDKGEPQ